MLGTLIACAFRTFVLRLVIEKLDMISSDKILLHRTDFTDIPANNLTNFLNRFNV